MSYESRNRHDTRSTNAVLHISDASRMFILEEIPFVNHENVASPFEIWFT